MGSPAGLSTHLQSKLAGVCNGDGSSCGAAIVVTCTLSAEAALTAAVASTETVSELTTAAGSVDGIAILRILDVEIALDTDTGGRRLRMEATVADTLRAHLDGAQRAVAAKGDDVQHAARRLREEAQADVTFWLARAATDPAALDAIAEQVRLCTVVKLFARACMHNVRACGVPACLQVAASVDSFNFTAVNVTDVAAPAVHIQPRCGNGFCEVSEADRGRSELCPADCQSLGWCPVALADAAVGTVGAVCGDIGTCKPATRQCSCPAGHAGESCTRCEFGYVPRGVSPLQCCTRALRSLCVRAPTAVPFTRFSKSTHGLAIVRRLTKHVPELFAS